MPKVDDITMAEIRERHQGCYILANEAGYDDDNDCDTLDVLVWETEEESEGDDGANAIARYTIKA